MNDKKQIYVGNRYVPKHCGEWDNTQLTPYESLSVVYWEGNSYTSVQNIPEGIDITNELFWVMSSNFNEQIAISETNLTAYKESVATSLANKVQQGNVSVNDINKNLGLFDQTFLSSDLIAQIAGTASINAVVEDESVTIKKMAFPAITGIPSKNRFNKDTITTGYYVSDSNGTLLANASYYASDYIHIQANTQYTKKNTNQYAFYDSNEIYISGSASGTTFTSPANTYYVRISGLLTQLSVEQLELGSISTTYESYVVKLDASTIPNGIFTKPMLGFDIIPHYSILPEQLTFVPMEGIPSKNYFNKDTVTTGYYVSNSNGTLLANASFSASDYIPVKPTLVYTKKTNSQYAFYDSDKIFISGSVSGTTFTTPANAYYERHSVPNTDLSTEQLELGSISTSYVNYGTKINNSSINLSGTSIDVKTDGTGNFTNLSDAIASITDSSELNPYNIYIYGETIDVYPNLTTYEKANIGIELPDYVNIIGIGDVKNNRIKMELSDATTLDESTRLSTLNIKKNNKLINLYVTAKNCRYVVHADNTNTFKNYVQNIENCIFEHFGHVGDKWSVTTAWGEGTASGSKVYAKNSKFISYEAIAFNTHNNVNFEQGDYHKLEGCEFITLGGDVALGFTTLSSTKVSKVDIIGCKFTGAIQQNQSNGTVTTLEYDIKGYGNEQVPHINISAQAIEKYIDFSEEITTRRNYNAIVIAKGSPLKHKFLNSAVPMETTDDKTIFLGLAVKSCLSTDKTVIVKTKGYFNINDTTITGISVGSKIGIVNGQLAIVTNITDAIAVVVNGAWMKFI